MGHRCRPTAPTCGRAGSIWRRPLGGGQLEAYGQIGDQVYRQAFSSIAASRATETLTVRQRVPASQFGYGLTWRRLFRYDRSARRGRDAGDRRHQRGDRVPSRRPPSGRSRTRADFSAAAACSRRSARSWARGRRSWREHVATCGNAQRDGLEGTGVLSPRVSVSHRLADRVTHSWRIHVVVPAAHAERALPRLPGRQRGDPGEPVARARGAVER